MSDDQIQKYYQKTKSNKPRKNVETLIKKIKCKPGVAIDLGCGAGNDTVYLLKNGWKVLAIDREDVEKQIRARLDEKYQKNFKFEVQNFEELSLNSADLIVSNYALSFCNNKSFKKTWEIIKSNILKDGYFVGTFLGINDTWSNTRPQMTFFSKTDIFKMFEDFEILEFNELDEDGKTALGAKKHWHIFDIIARKR